MLQLLFISEARYCLASLFHFRDARWAPANACMSHLSLAIDHCIREPPEPPKILLLLRSIFNGHGVYTQVVHRIPLITTCDPGIVTCQRTSFPTWIKTRAKCYSSFLTRAPLTHNFPPQLKCNIRSHLFKRRGALLRHNA